jgi:hypothetical protein
MRKMLESVRLRLLLLPFAAAALTVGCGQGNPLESPTGPSGTLGSTTFLTADEGDIATTAASAGEFELLAKGGNGKGRGGGNGNDDDADSDDGENGNGKKPAGTGGPGRSHQARVVGFVTGNDGTMLTVEGTSIVPGADAVIRHGHRVLTMADIAVGDHIQARGVMEGTTLVAEEIKVQDTGNDNVGGTGEAEIEGAISELSAVSGCPVVTFMIGTTKVTTSATTTFDDVTCAALVNGATVEVEGTTQTDGSILATKVEAEAGPDEVTGTVFELSASCPTSTFKVGPVLSLATTVTLTASTTFSGVTCETIANGAKVEVEGTEQADGSITAANVELK